VNTFLVSDRLYPIWHDDAAGVVRVQPFVHVRVVKRRGNTRHCQGTFLVMNQWASHYLQSKEKEDASPSQSPLAYACGIDDDRVMTALVLSWPRGATLPWSTDIAR
jgi:hypothetical protein